MPRRVLVFAVAKTQMGRLTISAALRYLGGLTSIVAIRAISLYTLRRHKLFMLLLSFLLAGRWVIRYSIRTLYDILYTDGTFPFTFPIARSRSGDDRSLRLAIRMDETYWGCCR